MNGLILIKLVEAGLSSLTFSMNALTRKTFEKIEVGLDFDVVMSNLMNLIEVNPSGLNIYVKFMIIRDNAIELSMPEEFSELLGILKTRRIPFGIDPISNRAGSLNNYDKMLVFENLQSSKNKSYCHDLFEKVNVLHNGDVIVCCADWLRKSVIGNLQEKTFEQIWNNSQAKDRRIKAMNGLYKNMEPCKTCSQAWNIMNNLGKL